MKVVFTVLILSTLTFANPYTLNTTDEQILNLTFNEQFNEAKILSEKQIELNPDSPKYYYYLINTMVMEYFDRITSVDAEKREVARKAVNSEIIEYCENVIDRFDDKELNEQDKFYFGTILGYLARIQGLDQAWWSAFQSGMKSQGIMEDLVEMNPDFYDAYLLIGMFEYYADRLSGVVGFVASVFGFSGDREKGLEYLHIAYEKGNLVFGQAALTLIEVYASLEDNELASLNYYKRFLSIYPNNKRIMNAYCHELLNTWRFDKVDSLIQINNYLIDDYVKARYYHTTGNSSLAIRHASAALESEEKMWRGVNNYARYILVFNNWLENNMSEVAEKKSLLNDSFSETFNRAYNNSEAYMWLHKLSVMLSAGVQNEALDKFLRGKPVVEDDEFEGQYNLLLGSYYLYMINNYVAAENYFLTLAASENDRNKYTAYKALIEIYFESTAAKTKVERLLVLIDEFDNDRLVYRSKDLQSKYAL
ncbi:MAG: hypothetical protein JW995_10640 [Melioribacteraceae bacterium]|nr:hypothetical protein [Melioribacteraceae bacterium]